MVQPAVKINITSLKIIAMTTTEIKQAIRDKKTLIWNDPDPIEGNDYTITSIVLHEEITAIKYNNGLSEAEVFNSEISLKDSEAMNTEESNELIRKFYYSFHTEHPKIEGSLPFGDYHNSMDWLFPVVNTIRSLYNSTKVGGTIEIEDIITDLAEGCIEANILQVNAACVDFVNWYNKNTPPL